MDIQYNYIIIVLYYIIKYNCIKINFLLDSIFDFFVAIKRFYGKHLWSLPHLPIAPPQQSSSSVHCLPTSAQQVPLRVHLPQPASWHWDVPGLQLIEWQLVWASASPTNRTEAMINTAKCIFFDFFLSKRIYLTDRTKKNVSARQFFSQPTGVLKDNFYNQLEYRWIVFYNQLEYRNVP